MKKISSGVPCQLWRVFVFAGMKTLPLFSFVGLFMVVGGEVLRKLAMFTAVTNFNHYIQHEKQDGHVLVTHGVYSYCRHPAYVGWFYWSVGTQVSPSLEVVSHSLPKLHIQTKNFLDIMGVGGPKFQWCEWLLILTLYTLLDVLVRVVSHCTLQLHDFLFQIMLCNPFCTIAYVWASWNFFNERIICEEITLLNFFGEDYLDYQKRVRTGLPLIKGYRMEL